jgi:hypothetical protein
LNGVGRNKYGFAVLRQLSSRVVGRPIAVVGPVRMVIGVTLDSVGPGRGDHEDHHLSFGRGGCRGDQVKPIVPIRVQQQQGVYAVLGRLVQLLVATAATIIWPRVFQA